MPLCVVVGYGEMKEWCGTGDYSVQPSIMHKIHVVER